MPTCWAFSLPELSGRPTNFIDLRFEEMMVTTNKWEDVFVVEISENSLGFLDNQRHPKALGKCLGSKRNIVSYIKIP